MISVAEAAKIKACSRQGIWRAIRRGEIHATQVGKAWVVETDPAFESWAPSGRQRSGRAAAAKRKAAMA